MKEREKILIKKVACENRYRITEKKNTRKKKDANYLEEKKVSNLMEAFWINTRRYG